MRTGGRAGTGPGSTDGAASCIRGLWAYRAAERDRGLVATRQLHARLGPALRRSAQHEAVRERLRGDRVEIRADSRGVRAEVRDELDPVVELEGRIAPQVLDGPLELAGVALGTQFVGELDVDHHDEPLVVRDRGSRARRGHDLDLVRCQHQAGDGDGAVGPDLEAVSYTHLRA